MVRNEKESLLLSEWGIEEDVHICVYLAGLFHESDGVE